MADEPRPVPRPSTPLLYLDVNDEITSAAARIRSAEGEHVALVLPYGSRLATSRINFRLLAREAEARGKRIEIVSADSSARALASAAGLTVHPSVASFEAARSGVGSEGGAGGAGAGAPGGGNHTEANARDGTGATNRGATIGSGAISAPGAAKAPVGGLSIEDDTRTRVLERPRTRPERVPIVGPPRPPMRTGLAIGLGLALVVLIAAGGFLALELLPSASIVLAPRSEPVGPVTLSVDARLDATSPDPAALVIPAKRVPFDLQAVETVEATGVKVTETKATGNVTFSNFDTGSSNRIAAGSVVRTETGLRYETLADVSLPPARLQFPFTVVPSTSAVAIEAVKPGPESNVGNNSITVVPEGEDDGLLQVSNEEATFGGSHTESPEISQRDVDAAIAALTGALAAELDRQVAAGVGVPPEVTLFDENRIVGEPEFATDPASLVGSPSPVPLVAMAEGTVLGVDPSPIQVIAESRLQARVTEGWSLATDSTSFELGTPSLFGDVVTYPATISATQVHDVDRAALLAQVRGLPIAEARSRLDNFGDVEISVWPDWVTTIPKNQERVSFTISEPRPAPSPTPAASPTP